MRRSSPGGGATSGATCVVVVHPVGNKNEITSKLRRESRKRAYERQKQFNERSVGQMSFHFLTIVVAVAIMVVTFAISEMMIVTTSEQQGKGGGDNHKPKSRSSSASQVFEEFTAAGDHHYYGQVNATSGGAATSLPRMTRTPTRTKTSPNGRMVTTATTTTRQMPLPGSDRVCNSDSPPFSAGQQRPGQHPKTVTITSRQVHQSEHQQGQCSVQPPPPRQQCPAPHQQRASSTSSQCGAAPNQLQHQAATTAASPPYNSDVYRKAKEEAKRIMLENPEKMKEVSEQLLKVTSAALQTLEQLTTTLANAANVANNAGGGRSKLSATPPLAAVSGGSGGGASSTP